MSNSSLSERVFDQIAAKGRVEGKDPAESIGRRIGVPTPEVRSAIRALEDDGSIVVKREAGQLREVRPQKSKRRYLDRTERSRWTKKEHTFARGVPSVLPDSLCGPVKVSYLPGYGPGGEACDIETKEEIEVVDRNGDPYYDKSRPFHENATDCLRALQIMADDEGVGERMSVRRVLLDTVHGLGESQCYNVMNHLRKLGLYETYMVGWQAATYKVKLDITEVTREMIAEVRQRQPKPQTAESERPTEPVSTEEAETSEASEATTESPLDAATVILRLTSIIASLESKCENLQAQVQAQADTIAQLEQQNADLRQRQEEPPKVVLSALEILERYPE